jgi:adenylate cyclase
LDGVQAAVEIQRVIGARNADLPAERRMEFRIGLHLGDITVEGERVYGDGVNVAARLEGLAQPGGVCISGTVYEQVEKKLTVELEDLGEQTLKNISRPVHVYGVQLLLTKAKPEATEKTLPGMDELTVPGFGGRPAIAVLPFDNLSGDPEQEYFPDGITEDLITRLSCARDFPVIARNSTLPYKGKGIDVRRLSEELGVRYVVEGSTRKAGDRVRISVQLIDATTGAHVWAERYDRDLKDIFAVQDEITEAIVASMFPELTEFEQKRAASRPLENLDAYEFTQRGNWHLGESKEDTAKARSLFQRAIELDPRSPAGVHGLGMTHYLDLIFQWSDSPADSTAELIRAAKSCVELDQKNALAQLLLGFAYRVTGEGEKALAAVKLAIELNPSLTHAYHELGISLTLVGRPDEAIPNFEKAMRLSPQDPFLFLRFSGMGLAHAAAGRYEEAVTWSQRSLQRKSSWFLPYLVLAVSHVSLGRTDEARAAIDELLRLSPDFSLAGVKLLLSNAPDPAFAERTLKGLRKAGLKE